MDIVFINITAVEMGFYIYSWVSSSVTGAVYTNMFHHVASTLVNVSLRSPRT